MKYKNLCSMIKIRKTQEGKRVSGVMFLESSEDSISSRNGYFSPRFSLDILDDKVIENNCIPSSASPQSQLAEIEGQAEGSRPGSIRIREGEDLVFEPEGLTPAAHNEGVIGSNNSDHIYTLGLELIVPFKVWWEMIYVASGGECSGNGKHDDLFTLPFISGELDGNTASVNLIGFGRVRDVAEGTFGHDIANFDRECHGNLLEELRT